MKSMMNLPTPPKYSLVDHKNVKDFLCVKIEDGTFENITYFYNIVGFNEEDAENPRLNFTYNIIDGYHSDLTKQLFEDTIASILLEVVETISSDK